MRTHFSLDYDYVAFRDLANAFGTPHTLFHIVDSGGTNVVKAYAEFAAHSVSIEQPAAPVALAAYLTDFPTSLQLPLAGCVIQAAS